MGSVLRVDADGPVRVVTLNRPEAMNAVNPEMHRRLEEIWGELAADPEAAAVVLTGAGTSFCTGGDVGNMENLLDPAYHDDALEQARRLIIELVAFPLPIVAALPGPAVGLGSSLAILCDIVLMAQGSYLSDPHVLVGLVAGDGGAAAWPANVSLLHAKEFLLTGDRVDAHTAVRIGLANRVVAADALQSEALTLAHRLARVPRQALQDTKRALNLHLTRALTGPLEFGLEAERRSMAGPDFASFVHRHLDSR